MANCSFNLFIKQTEGIGGASIAAIIIIILIILVIGGAVFYLKKQKMLCFAPHQEDTKETEQEKASFVWITEYSHQLVHCFVTGGIEKQYRRGEWKANYQRERKHRSKKWCKF